METLRRFAAIAVADLRERTRALRFWVILGIVTLASWWCFPAPGAGWMTLSIDDMRGQYSSAWVGMTLATMYSTIMAWLGFYLVRGSLVRDFDTRVWQLLVATPMTRAGYLLAKWASHMVVFTLVLAAGLAVGLVAQWVRAEDRAIDLVELVKPVLVLTLPALALTAFFAILFDMAPWLRRSAGNVIYFFVWVFMFAAFASNIDPSASEWARNTWFSDPSGVTLAQRAFLETLPQLRPGIDAGSLSIGVNITQGSTETYAWTRWTPGLADLGGRLLWVVLSILGTAALAPLLDAAARRTTATAPTRPGWRLRWLDLLLRPVAASATGLVLASEIKLVLRQRRALWWLTVLVAAVVQVAAPEKAAMVAVIVAWVASTDVFGRSLLRESETNTAELVMTGPGAARRLRIARLATALVIAIVPVLPAIGRLAMSAPADAGVLLLVAANVALCGLGLAALCRNARPFELLMVFCAYIGVQGGGPLAIPAAPSMVLAHLLAAALFLTALALLWPPGRVGDPGPGGHPMRRLRLALAGRA